MFPATGYQRAWGVLAAVGAAFAALLWLRQRRAEASPPVAAQAVAEMNLPSPPGEKKEDLQWLEETSSSTVEIKEEAPGEEWRLLFTGESLEGWVSRGSCYLSEGALTLQPWGTSVVSTDVVPSGTFTFQLEARKIAGDDGFVVLFPCGDRALAWVIGGWNNRRSELAGYPATRLDHAIERNKWYQVEIRAKTDAIEGLLDGQKMWKIQRDEIRASSPDAGFQTGLGVAVWNTLAKVQNIRYREI
jgi:hypothetical protein